MGRVYYYGPGMGHLALNKSFAGLRGFLQFGHTDGLFGSIISPIQVLPHPVHSNTFYCVNTCERQNKWDEEEETDTLRSSSSNSNNFNDTPTKTIPASCCTHHPSL